MLAELSELMEWAAWFEPGTRFVFALGPSPPERQAQTWWWALVGFVT
jgi:hypothetical protein